MTAARHDKYQSGKCNVRLVLLRNSVSVLSLSILRSVQVIYSTSDAPFLIIQQSTTPPHTTPQVQKEYFHHVLAVAYRQGVWGVQTPPEIPKALQNHAKLNPIVKSVKKYGIEDANTPRYLEKRQ